MKKRALNCFLFLIINIWCVRHHAACWDFRLLYKEPCAAERHGDRHPQVVLCMYEEAEELVTKWLRNPPPQQFHTCFPPFLFMFPHVSRSISPFFFQAFPLFPLVFLPIYYFRSWAIPNHAKYVNMSYTCGLGRPGVDPIKLLAGKRVFYQVGLLVVHFLQHMYSLPANVKIIFSSKY